MAKIVQREMQTTSKIVTSEDGKYTYLYTKELNGMEGKNGIFIMLYPTRNQENFFVEDSTNVHIQNHMRELGLRAYSVVNLFSKVTATRLSTRGLLVDTDNLEFLEKEIFEQVNTEDTEVIIAWGNSHLTSKAVNTAKKRILEIWTKTHPAVALKQIVADGLPKEISGVHPLYMGIRHSNAKWKLGTFPTKKELKIFAERERGGKKK